MNTNKLTFLRLLIFSIVVISLISPCLSQKGNDAQWATAGKQAVGTSASLESKVWLTLANGVLTEVYYPDVTLANVHLLQFVVVDPKTKKVETELEDAIHKIESHEVSARNTALSVQRARIGSSIFSPSSLAFKQINSSKTGDWRIEKTYITDPKSNTVLISVNFQSKTPDLEFYVYYDTSLANSGMHDTGWTEGRFLLSSDGEIASALTCGRCKFSNETNGFLGINDGLTQLRENGKIVQSVSRAEKGNLVQVAKVTPISMGLRPSINENIAVMGQDGKLKIGSIVNQSSSMIFALGFGKTPNSALANAQNSLIKGYEQNYREYQEGWTNYLKKLPKIDPKYQAQFNMAAMILKAFEDKTHRGANIASLSIPWGGAANANEVGSTGYHAVWARDLYQVATAFMALGDKDAANRALDFLFKVQQKPDGSLPQNSFLDGKPIGGSLQMDQVGFPLILAHELGRFDKETYEKHIKPAADFIVKNGPTTPQERWEEKGGYSPSTIAAEIAGLVCAAEIAKKNGDSEFANNWLKTADVWAANVEKWTVTTTGKHSKSPYYVRLTQNGKPDAGEKYEINGVYGMVDERDIVDAGFLELVRLGIKSPTDKIIQNTIKVVDEVIRVKTPNGDGFYRYNFDSYGEPDNGHRWNYDGKWTGKGRLWALLSGERGQFEIALENSRFKVEDSKSNLRSSILNLESAKMHLETMQKFANDGLMIPEQVWDSATIPQNIDRQFMPKLKFGEGTGSATPLAWSMAQFIRLAVNLKEGRNLDTPKVVYDRYVLGKKENQDEFIHPKTEIGSPINADKVKELQPNIQSLKLFNQDEDFGNFKVNWSCSFNRSIRESTSLEGKAARITKERNIEFWQCNEGKTTADIYYEGDGKKIEIVGDFTNWQPKGLELRNFGSSLKKLYYIPLEFSNFARIEYKLIVDGKWITDPLNPNKVDNGVGSENSFFTMPDYKPTEWDKDNINPDKNQTIVSVQSLETIEIDSKVYGEKRKIQVLGPIATEIRSTFYPVLYLQDGGEYINRANAVRIQQNLLKAGKIQPFLIVFLDPKDRMKEYWANDDYAKFLAEEVVPVIDSKYNTIKNRDGRAVMGASLGGITAVNVGLKYPNIFSRIGGQSSSFWVDNERIVKDLETLDGKTKFKFYFDDGTLEGVEDSKKVVDILRKKGFDVTYLEGETGHNWTAWRDRLADAFIALWK